MSHKRSMTVIAMHFPPETGAAARRMGTFVHALSTDGYEVRVVTQLPNYPQREIYAGYKPGLVWHELDGGVQVTRLWPLMHRQSSLLCRSLGEVWFMLWAFLCSLSGPPPHLVMATCPSTFSPIAGWAVSFIRRARFILEIRDLTWNYAANGSAGRRLLSNALERAILWVAKRAALVICTNKYQQEYLVARGALPDRCQVIPNGIDAELLDQLAAPRLHEQAGRKGGEVSGEPSGQALTAGADSPRFHVMYVGLIGHPQGLRVLVETARLLSDDPNYHVTAVGEGLERAELSQLAAEWGLSNISFVGGVPSERVAQFYRCADVLVAHLRDNPAFHTALPSKLFEYMAANKPIIYGGHGPGADLVTAAKAGLVVPPDSAQEMAAAIRYLAHDSAIARRMGESGYAHVTEHYRREVILAQLLRSLREAGGGGPAAPGAGTNAGKRLRSARGLFRLRRRFVSSEGRESGAGH